MHDVLVLILSYRDGKIQARPKIPYLGNLWFWLGHSKINPLLPPNLQCFLQGLLRKIYKKNHDLHNPI